MGHISRGIPGRPAAWAQEARGGDIAGSMAATSNPSAGGFFPFGRTAMRNVYPLWGHKCPSRQAVG